MAASREPQQSVALTGSRSRAGRVRRAMQVVLGAGSWIGFVLLWIWQLQVYVPSTWLYSICLIAGILAVWVVFTICWVRWNRNIYTRRHRRTAPARHEVAFEEDTLGRPVKASGGIRAAEGQIIVSVDADGAKRYDRARSRRLPRLPNVLPDWDSIPVFGGANGNGNGKRKVHEPVLVPLATNGNGHANGNGNGNGNGHHDEVRERVEELVR